MIWIFIILVSLLRATDLSDRAISTQMTLANAGTQRVQILSRVKVTDGLAVVVSVGYPKSVVSGAVDGGWWVHRTSLGLFLQEQGDPEKVYKLLIETGLTEGDCFARLERVTTTDIVIACSPEKGSERIHHKFLYDLRAKELVGRVEYRLTHLDRVVRNGPRVILAGSDGERAVAIDYDDNRNPPFQVLADKEASRWGGQEPVPHPGETKRVRFGNGLTAVIDSTGLRIEERRGSTVRQYGLQQSSYDEFAKQRPKRVRDGYTREASEIGEQIGAYQIADNAFWFAKAFCDGEGHTGTGGFGYFDTASRSYRIVTPPEIADWSVTAMLVEADAVWLALAHHGEWATSAGGLLHFDRSTEKVTRFELPDVVSQIARVQDRLLLATQGGAAILEAGRLRRFFVDPLSDGRVRMAEAVLGE